jgi:hypothetical protein
MASEIRRSRALFAACLGAGLGTGLAGLGADSGTIAAGVVAVPGMIRPNRGARPRGEGLGVIT